MEELIKRIETLEKKVAELEQQLTVQPENTEKILIIAKYINSLLVPAINLLLEQVQVESQSSVEALLARFSEQIQAKNSADLHAE